MALARMDVSLAAEANPLAHEAVPGPARWVNGRTVAWQPPNPYPSYAAAFVLLARVRDGIPVVLLAKEQRGRDLKLGLLGGKREDGDGGSPFNTACREAWEETSELLSRATQQRLLRGDVVGHLAWVAQSRAVAMVCLADAADDSVVARAAALANGAALEWVATFLLLSPSWRAANMHTHAAWAVEAVATSLGRVRPASPA